MTVEQATELLTSLSQINNNVQYLTAGIFVLIGAIVSLGIALIFNNVFGKV